MFEKLYVAFCGVDLDLELIHVCTIYSALYGDQATIPVAL